MLFFLFYCQKTRHGNMSRDALAEMYRRNRALNEGLHSAHIDVIGDINLIINRACDNSPESVADIVDHLRDASLPFTEVPRNYKRRAPKQYIHAESVVKASTVNEDYEAALHSRDNSPQRHSVIVALEGKKLPLSYEAQRKLIRAKHSKQAQSIYSGLFSKNANVNPDVEQGPIPDLYTPLPTSRRHQIEEQKEQIRAQFIKGDPHRKQQILTPKHVPQLLGKKVNKEFIPSCCREVTSDRRHAVEQKIAAEHAVRVTPKPFR
jgi:hypothetical protein